MTELIVMNVYPWQTVHYPMKSHFSSSSSPSSCCSSCSYSCVTVVSVDTLGPVKHVCYYVQEDLYTAEVICYDIYGANG